VKVLYIAIGVLSLPATLILSNLFWRGLREGRAIAVSISDRELLHRVVTPDLLNNPPVEVARFAEPMAGGYSLNMRAFRQSDEDAHGRARKMLRPAVAVVVVGSGVVGFLGLGWLGLALPILNLLFAHTTFVGSTRGAIGNAAMARAIEHVQIVALILHRWRMKNSQEAADWIEREPQMKLLWEHLETLHTY
jgi:hypothetical protein